MGNIQLLNIFYVITLLFFLFGVSMYIAYIFVFFKDKSFKIKTESKNIILKSWFLGLFIVAFFYTMYQLKTSGNFILTINVFLIGFSLMIMFYILPKIIVKNKRFIAYTLKEEMGQEIEAGILTDNLEIFKSNQERTSIDNSTTNNNTTINNNTAINVVTNYDIKIRENKDFKDGENFSREFDDKDYLKLKESAITDEILDLQSIDSLNFEEFNDFENFRREGTKTVLLKRGGRKKLKDRQYLLYILDKKFGGHFSKIEKDDLKKIKEVVIFINKHIIFKCEKCPDENEYNAKNFKDWLEKANK